MSSTSTWACGHTWIVQGGASGGTKPKGAAKHLQACSSQTNSDSCKEKAHGFSRSSHHFCYTATRWGSTQEHKKALKVSLLNRLHLHLIIPTLQTPGSDLLQSGANWGRREVACVRQINTPQRRFSLSALLWRRLKFQCIVPGLVSASSSSLSSSSLCPVCIEVIEV